MCNRWPGCPGDRFGLRWGLDGMRCHHPEGDGCHYPYGVDERAEGG